MEQKIVAQLDTHGYFVCAVEADSSPLEPGVFLIPGMAVDAPPPQNLQAGKRYRFQAGVWQEEELPTKQTEAKFEEAPEMSRGNIIRQRLHEIDMESIRPTRTLAHAIAQSLPVPEAEGLILQSLEQEASKLRAELSTILPS